MSESAQMITFENLRAFMVQCNHPKNTEVRKKLVEQFYDNEEMLKMLEILIKTLSNLQERQHCANMIDLIFEKRINNGPKPIHFRRIFTYFTQNLLDFDFPVDVKKLFFQSFSFMISQWQEEMKDFWQEVTQALIDILQLAGSDNCNTQQQYFCKNINTICLSQPFPVMLHRCFNAYEVYLTIHLLLSVFFKELKLRDSAYQERCMKMLKKVHRQIFNTDFIISKSRVIYRFLSFELTFFRQIREQKELAHTGFIVTNWSELMAHLQVVILAKAMPFQQKQKCYNFFLLSDHWQQNDLLQIKALAFDIINEAVTISEQLLDSTQQMQSVTTLDFLSDSVYYSLLWMVEQNRSAQQSEPDLELALMRNFFLYINIFNPNLEQRKAIVNELILPIILFELNQNQIAFQQGWEDQIQYLTDCIFSNRISFDYRLGLANIFLEQILDGEGHICTYIRTYMFAALAARLTNFQNNHQQTQTLPMEICFYVLCILDIQNHSESLQQKAFGTLLTESVFLALSKREKKFLYFYLGMTWQHYFGSNQSDVIFINYIFSAQIEIDVEYYALDFIFQMVDDYCNDDFILKFLRYFPNFRNEEKALDVASKLVCKYLNRINEYIICIFVKFCADKAEKMADELLLEMQNSYSDNFNTCRIAHYMATCCAIAKDTEYVNGKPDLIHCLVDAFRLTPKMAKISAQEHGIRIGTEVLSAVKRFPDKFKPIIPDVMEYFRASEYHGNTFCQFFAACMETISTYPFDEQMSKLVSHFYQTYAESYAYFVYYPDPITDEQKKNLGEAQVLLLNLFIYFGDKMSPKMINQATKLSKEMLKVEEYYREVNLLVRTNILLLLCEILTSKNYPIKQIYTAVKGKFYQSKADSKLLIYLLNQIRPALQPPDQFLLALTVLELLKSSQSVKLNRNIPFKQMERYKQFTSIFSFITLPVQLFLSQLQQAYSFFKTYRVEDSVTCELVMRQIQFGKDYEHLQPFLQKIITFKQNDLANINLFHPDQPICGSDEDERTNSATPRQVPRTKRKIVKIIGEKDANGNSQIFYTQSNFKRKSLSFPQQHNEESEDDRQLDSNVKRRKINEQPSLQKISKRVLMREKQSKKVVRL